MDFGKSERLFVYMQVDTCIDSHILEGRVFAFSSFLFAYYVWY